MKGKLLLLVVLAVGLFSCRKDKYDFSEKQIIVVCHGLVRRLRPETLKDTLSLKE